MFVITHGLSPVVGAGFADLISGKRLELSDLILIGIAGAAPDVLSPHISLEARLHSWTHNLWFLLGSSIVWYGLALSFVKPRWFLTGNLMVSATAWHLFCDAISGGIAWLYPLNETLLARRWVPFRYWLLLDLCCIGATIALWWGRRWVTLRQIRRI